MKVCIAEAEMPVKKVNDQWLPVLDGNYTIEKIGENKYFIIVNGKTYTAQCLSMDKTSKEVEILLNGRKILTKIKEPLDDLLHDMGLDKATNKTVANIKAPMPGMVLSVLVKEGQAVSKGDKVLVLEAMKMENIIKAGGDGIVARILVDKGQTVDKNQVLIEFT